MHPADLAVHRLAAAQWGAFARPQVLAAGGTDQLIQRRRASGRWLVITAGVYVLAGHPPSYRQSLWAAWLATPEAVVSHWSGGWLQQLEGFPPNRLTLTVPHGAARANPLARVFQTRAMPAPTLVGGLPVASVERILVDLGRLAGPRKLEHLVEAARTADRTNPVRLRREFLRLARSGRNGITTMRTVLDRYEDGPVPARSELERALDRILVRLPVEVAHEAPLPGREWSLERVDRRIDHPRRLVIEGDGRRWHTRVGDFRRDRERDRVALRAGYPTVRYAYEELTEDPDGVLQELHDLLGILEGLATGIR